MLGKSRKLIRGVLQNDMIMAAPPEECLETYFASRVDFAPLPDIASLRVYR